MIELGIVGIAGWGGVLIDAIGKAIERGTQCRLVAAADGRLGSLGEREEKLKSRGVELYADAMEMFGRISGRCQAVYIATSIPSHAPLTVAAAGAGLHVHLEKPPAATVQEVDAMLAALERAGKLCIVGFQAVHGREMQLLKTRIVEGRLGGVRKLICRACWPRDATYYSRNNWSGRLRSGDSWVLDGPATNALLHQINNMLYLASGQGGRFAQPAGVQAELYRAGPADSHDTAAIRIRTGEGAEAIFLATHCCEQTLNPVIKIQCEKGAAFYNMFANVRIDYADGTSESEKWDDSQMAEMVGNFCRAIQTGDESLLGCGLAESRKTILAIDGSHESSGRVHPIDEKFVSCVNQGQPSQKTIIDGIEDLISRAAEDGKLFSELPDRPAWAVETGEFSLAGYKSFPQRFSP
ncbi:MAG: Gfo/Idh/MocA family oxidoreductase [Planctomycetes bacterium]|nr:Gfo/Idh/MocA family oxidoreductase [Planctomycetota bacterium]